MKIKYEVNSSMALTPCPYKGHKPRDSGWIFLPKVGSLACSECKFFISIDYDNHIVECSADYHELDQELFKI
jgi:hypothetical protein